MYVCLCNAITEREVTAAVDLGARTLEDLQHGLGVATCCGKCADCACALLEKSTLAIRAAA
jgi:bacterioferritin-associated ferredoxin